VHWIKNNRQSTHASLAVTQPERLPFIDARTTLRYTALLMVVGIVEQDIEDHATKQFAHLLNVFISVRHAAPPRQLH
jgi:hypothetical protein